MNRKKVQWIEDSILRNRIQGLVKHTNIKISDFGSIKAVRSYGTKTRAVARIWGLGNIWQVALKLPPSYIIEVISEKFDRLPYHQQDEVILHELAHIPTTFSGALVPHTRKGKSSFHSKLKAFINIYRKSI